MQQRLTPRHKKDWSSASRARSAARSSCFAVRGASGQECGKCRLFMERPSGLQDLTQQHSERQEQSFGVSLDAGAVTSSCMIASCRRQGKLNRSGFYLSLCTQSWSVPPPSLSVEAKDICSTCPGSMYTGKPEQPASRDVFPMFHLIALCLHVGLGVRPCRATGCGCSSQFKNIQSQARVSQMKLHCVH